MSPTVFRVLMTANVCIAATVSGFAQERTR